MNPYQFECVCDICGGPGKGNVRTAAASWIVGESVVHTNPRTCREYLEERKRKLDKREAELNERENKKGDAK